jgi:drug/metabolite transporter (DMT)-like permease
MASTNIIRETLVPARPLSARPWQGLALLGVVYLVWGSTFIAIHFAISGEGFSAFTLGALRLAGAGAIMLLWAALAGQKLWHSPRAVLDEAVAGSLLWLGGNGLVIWALARVETGYAALMMSSIPMWAVVIESVARRRLPAPSIVRALALGFAGIAVLSLPAMTSGRADFSALVALMAAAACWAAGSVYQKSRPSRFAPVASAAQQLLLAALGFAVVALLAGEEWASPAPASWWALAYLALVGGVVGFGSYVAALRTLPVALVMTHAYVNPVVAVLLGWFFVNEAITPFTWLGTALVLVGVAATFRQR